MKKESNPPKAVDYFEPQIKRIDEMLFGKAPIAKAPLRWWQRLLMPPHIHGPRPRNSCRWRHRWLSVRETATGEYQVCVVCGRRRFRHTAMEYGAIDMWWLKHGEWTTRPSPPPPPPPRREPFIRIHLIIL